MNKEFESIEELEKKIETNVYCEGQHPIPLPLRNAEIEFCNNYSQKFNGKMLCMNCQSKHRMRYANIKNKVE